jgi:pyridoxal phosphate enzyme (YggS family)
MGDIANNISIIKKSIPDTVTLIAVSKTKPPEDILEAYNAGQKVFGENKVQELVYKYETLPKEIEWHMIGHLQSNKVKYIASFVSLIHSVDSYKLLQVIDAEAKRHNRIINCLLQVKIANEETKFGFEPNEAQGIFRLAEINKLKNVGIVGVMGMATYTEDENRVRAEFKKLHSIFHSIKAENPKISDQFKEISMGMSDDYCIAIEEGSTMVRLGSIIFGKRIYLL